MSLANPTEGVDTSNAPYVFVSSDTHAGLQCEEYRPYLDSALHDEFDVYVAGRQRPPAGPRRRSTLSSWPSGRARTPTGCGAPTTPRVRDKELDADGIAGEVIFADGDAVTGQESPPFGAGLAAGQITDSRQAFGGARAHNRWLVEFCATNPPRRAGVGLVPITHDIDESVAEIEVAGRQAGHRRDHGPHHVARLPALRVRPLRPGVGRLRGDRA